MNFNLIPAIDLRDGRVVRLYQGDYAKQTDYAVAPPVLAREYAAAGAEWLHVVDLDGARAGHPMNLQTITALAHVDLKLQAGGGVRGEGDLRRLFDAGVARVVIGSIAIRDPQRVAEWLETWGPERLTIALDTRWRDGAWCLASGGWIEDEAATLEHLAPFYEAAGARHLLCTDINCDGALRGPNLKLYAFLREVAPKLALQASGGIRNMGDIDALRRVGVAGAVLGRALLEGHFTLGEALLSGAGTAPC